MLAALARAPSIAIEPEGAPHWLAEAVVAGGGVLTSPADATGLVWYGRDAGQLRRLLEAAPSVRWVQLPSAGIERYLELIGDGRLWTCAKAIYGEAVAEHALAMILASLRDIPSLARRRAWIEVVGGSLYDSRITIVGAGGITGALLPLLAPFRVSVTVVRRHPTAVDGANGTWGQDRLLEALSAADCVVLACALTAQTAGMIGARELEAMPKHALLVNVARGALVRTGELVAALERGLIGGAALDVTDPEPLPKDHPLWGMDNVLITPHSANPDERGRGPLAELVRDNVRRFADGRTLLGQASARLGY
ncbi:hydroxyacid dehydrogenase [bacterium]|nr:MAG: hydroxyacid dehydrogenase [bacterium]